MNEAETMEIEEGVTAEADNTLRDVKFIFDSVRLRLFSSANILQIADVALGGVFLLLLPCF